ncbi:MAG: serine/threonine-protein kinase [Fuerstiella sp.]
MDAESQDRNLLVAVIALQMDYITQPQLIEAMKDWVFNKSEAMETILARRNFLKPEHAKFLKAIVRQHLNVHANNVAESLAALTGLSSTQQHLDGLDDQLDATILEVSKNRSAQRAAAADSLSFDTEEADLSFSKRFRILRSHAKGGLGEVSIANDTELNRQVAVKQIQQPFDGQPESRHRFLAEAEITGKLEHPGIVPVYSLGCDDQGRPFYAMRFIRGDSLKESLSLLHHEKQESDLKSHRFRLRQLVGRLVDVCNAIHYAHSRGILHRDLKPGNIMLGRYGETLVVDWGLAKPIGKSKLDPDRIDPLAEETLVPRSGEGSTETRMGSVVGTLAYMSPEQADGRIDSLGPWSDVYGLGATLFSILTGKQPIAKADQSTMLRDISEGRVLPVHQHSTIQDAAIKAICAKAMALSTDDRYTSAGELAEDLELWLADEPVTAFAEPLRLRTYRWIKKHRTFCTTAASLVLVTAIGMSTAVSLLSTKNSQLEAQQTKLNESYLGLQNFTSVILARMAELASSDEQIRSVQGRLLRRTYEQLKPLASELNDPEFRLAFSDAARNKASMSLTIDQPDEALLQYDEAIDVLTDLIGSPGAESEDDRIRQIAKTKLIEVYGEKANACRRNNFFQAAHKQARNASALLTEVLADGQLPERDAQMLIGRTKLNQAYVFRDNEDWKNMEELANSARLNFADAEATYLKERKKRGINQEGYRLSATEFTLLAMIQQQKFAEVDQLVSDEITKLKAVIQSEGVNWNRRYATALLLNAKSFNELAMGTVSESTIVRQTEAVSEMHARYMVSESGALAQRLCRVKLTLALCYLVQKREDDAEAVLKDAIKLLTPHTETENSPAEYVRTLARCHATKALLKTQQGTDDRTIALSLAERAAKLSGELPYYVSLRESMKQAP